MTPINKHTSKSNNTSNSFVKKGEFGGKIEPNKSLIERFGVDEQCVPCANCLPAGGLRVSLSLFFANRCLTLCLVENYGFCENREKQIKSEQFTL